MCYYFYMNKDVIYIEPEDDITDIIAKIENSKSKIVAIVPPKKAGVFRSVVNMKLISKSASSSEKSVVLVSTDPSIMKLAGAVKMPVTKDLKSAPVIPNSDENIEEVSKEEVKEEPDEEEKTEEEEKDEETKDDVKEEAKDEEKDEEDDDSEDENDDKEDKKAELSLRKVREKRFGDNKIINWIRNHKKLAIIGSILGVLLIAFLIWALIFAPSAVVTVGIKTDVRNFSENVTFTSKLEEEDADQGKFYLEEKKIEDIKKVEFEATGSKNVGNKAGGEVVVYASIHHRGGVVVVNAGDTFTNNGLKFIADNGARLAFDGDDLSVCANGDVSAREFREQGCRIYAKVSVTASAPGTSYNISATDSGWSTSAPVGVYSDSAMTGGTDDIITIVSEEDVKKAKEEITTTDEQENKEKLLEGLADNLMPIDSSFLQTSDDAISEPAVGEKVESDKKATLTAKTTAVIYVIDKTKIEEFIRAKAKLEDNQKIYEIKSPFIENFMESDEGFAGKLKTSYAVGPKITENDVIDIIKGKGLGQAQHDLRDINGVSEVRIDRSYPWVNSVPKNPNKITIILEVKE